MYVYKYTCVSVCVCVYKYFYMYLYQYACLRGLRRGPVGLERLSVSVKLPGVCVGLQVAPQQIFHVRLGHHVA